MKNNNFYTFLSESVHYKFFKNGKEICTWEAYYGCKDKSFSSSLKENSEIKAVRSLKANIWKQSDEIYYNKVRKVN